LFRFGAFNSFLRFFFRVFDTKFPIHAIPVFGFFVFLCFAHFQDVFKKIKIISFQVLPGLVGTNVFNEFERRWKHLFFSPAVLMGVASPHQMIPRPWHPPFARMEIAECRREAAFGGRPTSWPVVRRCRDGRPLCAWFYPDWSGNWRN
jgi:hypothetical protein